MFTFLFHAKEMLPVGLFEKPSDAGTAAECLLLSVGNVL